LTLLLRNLDLAEIARRLREANAGWVILGIVLSGASLLANVGQWSILLRGTGRHLPWPTLTRWYLQGVFVGQVVPAGGDVVRTVEAARVTSTAPALAAVAGGRMTGALAMALCGVAGAIIELSTTGRTLLVANSLFAMFMIAAWAVALESHPVVTALWRGRGRLTRAVRSFTGSFDDYRRRPLLLTRCLIVGIIGWAVNLWALQALAQSTGLHPRWTLLAVALPTTLIAGLFPLTLNGVGVREGVLVGLLVASGETATRAGVIALLLDLQSVPFALLGAALWLRSPLSRRHTPPMSSIALHHVQVNVPNIDAAVSFYEGLGMTRRTDRPDFGIEGVWLNAGEQQIHLVKGSPPADLGQHFALEVADLDTVVATLRRQGLRINDPIALGPGLPRQTAVHDPAGNRVELREPQA